MHGTPGTITAGEIPRQIPGGSAQFPGNMCAMVAATRFWPQRHLAPQHSGNAQGVKAPKCGASEVFTPRCPQRLRRGTGIFCVPENPYFQWETTQLLCILHQRLSLTVRISCGQPSALAEKWTTITSSKNVHFSIWLVRRAKFMKGTSVKHGLWNDGKNGLGRCGKWQISSHIDAIWVPFLIRCTHLLQRCVLVVLLVGPFFYFASFHVVLGTPWCYSIVSKLIEVPTFQSHNWSIFVKKNHCNHFKWVFACQSSKKLGKTKMESARCMMRRRLQLCCRLMYQIVCNPPPFFTVLYFS